MTRGLLGTAGVVLAGYGIVRLLQRGWADTFAAAGWLAGGVLAHDVLLAPATIVVGLLLLRVVPVAWRGAVVAGSVVLATVTLSAVPALGRFGAREDNPTLLDRDYLHGWLAFLAVVTLATVAGGLWHARRTTQGGSDDGADPRRRRRSHGP